jgi:hypothetical protein
VLAAVCPSVLVQAAAAQVAALRCMLLVVLPLEVMLRSHLGIHLVETVELLQFVLDPVWRRLAVGYRW